MLICAKTLYNSIDQCLLTVRNIDLLLKVKRKLSGSSYPRIRSFGLSYLILQFRERIDTQKIAENLAIMLDRVAVGAL